MNQLLKLIQRLLGRHESVDELLSSFDKQREKLVAMSTRLRETASKKEEEAVKLQAEAARKALEAERATTVADRFANLLSK